MFGEARTTTFADPAWFELLQDSVSEDRELAVFGRWSTFGFALQVGENVFLIRLLKGNIEKIVTEPDISDPWSFKLAGSKEDWKAFLQEIPPPFYHDLLAMNTRIPTFSIEGDWHMFVQHIRTIKRIFRIAQSLEVRVA